MKVIVTGAKGFVGKEIVAELLENKHSVFRVGRIKQLESNELADKNSDDYFSADITVYKTLTKLEKLENIDAVIHSAGLAHQFGDIEKEKFYRINVLGTKNIAELAVKIKAGQFILISSTAVYGIKKNSIDEETLCQPETLYAESKLEAEKECIEICTQNNLPLTILRLAPVIGENNVGNAARLVSAIDKRRFVWIGKGKNLKTLIYKRDAARAVVEILQNKKDKIEIFNLAAKPISMENFVLEIEKHLKKNAPKIFIPSGIMQKIFSINKKTFGFTKINKLSETVKKWLSDDVYSAQKIKQMYNFEPRTSMAEAVERQVKCYLADKNKG